MNAFRLVLIDFVKGTLKSKRTLFLIYVVLIQCMLMFVMLDQISSSQNIQYGFIELLTSIYSGSEPFLKLRSGQFPYSWFALFVCPLILTFDHIHIALMEMGIQTLPRLKRRRNWWIMNCIWNILTISFSYLVILSVILLFCSISGISFYSPTTSKMLLILTAGQGYYESNGVSTLSTKQLIIIVLSPFIATVALSLFQMFLSLFLKPLYSLAVTAGFVILSIAEDWFFLFPRIAMIPYNDIFCLNGFKIRLGMAISAIVIMFSIGAGAFYFKKYDIIPIREENQ